MAGADLANILNEGAILAARAGRTEITMADLEEASEKFKWDLKENQNLFQKKKN